MYVCCLLLHLLLSTPSPAPATAPAPLPAPQALYLSDDLGNSWTTYTEGLPAGALAMDLAEIGGDLYLSTDRYGFFRLPAGDCVWVPFESGLPDAKEVSFTALAGTPELLALATFQNGVYFSRDRGATWHRPALNLDGVITLSLTFHDGVLYAGTDKGVYQYMTATGLFSPVGEERFAVYGLLSHAAGLVVARQNGFGLLRDGRIAWADAHTKSAVIQLFTEGDQTYALTAVGTIYRSADLIQWYTPSGPAPALADAKNRDASTYLAAGFHAPSCSVVNGRPALGEALWHGWRPALPAELREGMSTRVRATGRGWMVLVRGGC